MTDELRLAAVLVGLYGRAEDLPLLQEVRETDFDKACGLSEIPEPDADAAPPLWSSNRAASSRRPTGTRAAEEPERS